MKKIALLLIILICSQGLLAQGLQYGWHNSNSKNSNLYTISSTTSGDTLYTLYSTYNDSIDAKPGVGQDWIVSHDGSVSYSMIYVTLSHLNGDYIDSYKLMENTANYIYVYGLSVKNGQIILTGYTSTNPSNYELDYDPTNAVVPSYSLSAIGSVSFIAFYSTNGNYQARIEYPYNNSGYVYFSDHAITNQNELIVVGSISGALDMDFTSGIDSLVSTAPIYESDALVLSIDLNTQSYSWSKVFGNTTGDEYISFVRTVNDKLVFMGSYESSNLDLDPSNTGTWNVQNNNGDAVFVSSWDTDGNFISGIGLYTEELYGYVYTNGLAVDENNNIYVNGYTYNGYTVDLDPTLNTQLVNTTKNYNHFLAKYSLNFALMWNKNIQTSNDIYFNNEESESAIEYSSDYLGIVYESSSDLVSYSDDISTDTLSIGSSYGFFVAALDPISGNIFSKTRVDFEDVNDSYVYLSDISIDENQNIHIAGDFEYLGDFNQTNTVQLYDTSHFNVSYYDASPFNLMFSTQNFLNVSENNINSIQVELFPNPTTEFIELVSVEKITQVVVYDFSGKQMDIIQINENQFDLSNLTAGTYFIRIETINGNCIKKINKL